MPSRAKLLRGRRQWTGQRAALRETPRRSGSEVPVLLSLGPRCPLLPKGSPQDGYSPVWGPPHHTNGKKKLKGSLALMVGGARKPASAGADTSTNVTAVEMTMVLSGPGRGCKERVSAVIIFLTRPHGQPEEPHSG